MCDPLLVLFTLENETIQILYNSMVNIRVLFLVINFADVHSAMVYIFIIIVSK